MGSSGLSIPLRTRVASLLGTAPYARPGSRTQLERVVLGVREGMAPSEQPPVRIFVGTEPDQYRAERIFVWSIEQVRDPSRVYELYLMKDLAGFDRRGWLTGFTNYRFAIPHFAEGHGRAIYNDADQIYLADPGELFDTALGNCGFLSIHDHDTSVMLIDCERMAPVWTLAAARQRRRKLLEAEARAVPGLWGQLDPHWNARDDEYDPERSKLLHYTTIHAQPWQPFPQRFAYQHNPVGQVWFGLEQRANEAGYQVFQAQRPSAQYLALCAHIRDASTQPAPSACSMQATRNGHSSNFQGHIEKLSAATQSRTLLDYSFGLGPSLTHSPGPLVSRYNPAFTAPTPASCKAADGVVCTDILDFLPDEDVPWMLEELFRHALRFVSVSVSAVPYERHLPNGVCLQGRARPLPWWRTHLDSLSPRYPNVQWHLTLQPPPRRRRPAFRPSSAGGCSGGNLGRQPVVWVLTSHKPGTTTQALGLANALGWPYTTKALRFRPPSRLYTYTVGQHRPTLMGLDQARSAVLDPPWPDLIIAAGWQPAQVARWVQQQNRGRTQLVILGRKGSRPLQPTEVSIVCTHSRFPPHPRQIETLAPLTQVSPARLRQGAAQWRPLVQDAPHPWIMLLVGGATARYQLDPQIARKMGEDVRAFAERVKGKVFATTSRRTGKAATEALLTGLGPSDFVYAWQPDQQENPYMGYLALADILIVTGESESMLAEAAATATPLYIYPLPKRPDDMRGRGKEWIVNQAQAKRLTPRGSVRPQRGISYLCARLIERGFVQPRRDLNALHEALVQRGMARFFGASVDLSLRPALREFDTVAQHVRRLLGSHLSPEQDAQHYQDTKSKEWKKSWNHFLGWCGSRRYSRGEAPSDEQIC